MCTEEEEDNGGQTEALSGKERLMERGREREHFGRANRLNKTTRQREIERDRARKRESEKERDRETE